MLDTNIIIVAFVFKQLTYRVRFLAFIIVSDHVKKTPKKNTNYAPWL